MHDYLIFDTHGDEVALYRAETAQQALDVYPNGYQAVQVAELPERFKTCPVCQSTNTRRYGYRLGGQPKRRCDGCGKTYGLNGFKPGMKYYQDGKSID
jgi:hypothetical protein